ncbi:MAG: SRPBCC domain-containing protein [Nitrospirae bacterium]|nr:SRPBCC domain-containing protein [Nitrospirota bacterium]
MTILSIKKEIQINASPTVVFEAITDPNRIICYYPINTVQSEGKIGGSIFFSGKNDGHTFTDYGTIEVFDNPYEFRYSYWSDNHGTVRAQENQSLTHLKFLVWRMRSRNNMKAAKQNQNFFRLFSRIYG